MQMNSIATLTKGANVAVPGTGTSIAISWSPEKISGLDVDMSAFLLRADGKVGNDGDMVFFNQKDSAGGGVQLQPGRFLVDFAKIPAEVERVAFTVTIYGGTPETARFGNASSVVLEAENAARYEVATAGMTESALILAELYRRDGGWKLRAIGQGFAGGLGPLARNFGVDTGDQAAAPPPPTRQQIEAQQFEAKLVDLQKRAPELVSLVKKVQVSLEKKNLVTGRAKVALVLDISASMNDLYRRGAIQSFLMRAMALAFRFDDNAEIDIFLFGSKDYFYGTVNLDNYRTFVPDMLKKHSLEGDTRYGRVMKRVREFYGQQPDAGDLPVYVMFLTDGGTNDRELSERMILESSREPIFWSFMAIGKAPGTGLLHRLLPSGFEFLEHLDKMPGRLVDNAGFFCVEDPSGIDDEKLFGLLMQEYPEWQAAAHRANLFKA